MAKNLRLTLAVGDYDHMRDLALDRVRPQGIDLTVLNYDVEEIFFRFHDRLEWDVSELSMGMYCSAISRGDNRFIALPVFPSRVFRHSAIYVRADGDVRTPGQLIDKRVGIAQWSQTATIYVRGFIAHSAGVPLGRIRWIQAGVNDPGRAEPSTLRLPDDIRIESVVDRSLTDMLLAGDLDAIISARPPRAFTQGDKRVVRMFPDYRTAETAYFKETGIFPIMHTVAIRRDVYEANRWIARNLTVAFDEAKNRSVARMLDFTAAHVPLPWVPDLAETVGRGLLFPKGDFWPYGIEANRVTLTAFLDYAYEQGVCHRRLTIEEIFAEEALAQIRV
ncbi:MAG: 4,5-dihydroxyphthalate decarboxylase [Alphaproteobacteria bacterium]